MQGSQEKPLALQKEHKALFFWICNLFSFLGGQKSDFSEIQIAIGLASVVDREWIFRIRILFRILHKFFLVFLTKVLTLHSRLVNVLCYCNELRRECFHLSDRIRIHN